MILNKKKFKTTKYFDMIFIVSQILNVEYCCGQIKMQPIWTICKHAYPNI